MPTRPADPTRTTTLRKVFATQFNKRFRRLINLIDESLVTNNALGEVSYLSASKRGANSINARFISQNPYVPDTYIEGSWPLTDELFGFPTDKGKVSRFMRWLQSQESIVIFQQIVDNEIPSDVKQVWPNVYIKNAYKHGMLWARHNINPMSKDINLDTSVEAIDRDSMSPGHLERVKNIYIRSYDELVGITTTMDAQISAALSDGMLRGLGAREISKNLAEQIKNIGIKRAKLLARTETIRAHHVASIEEYRQAGILEVKVMAEWSTAGDGRVCRRCSSLDYARTGKLWTLDEIEPLIPLHPQCRCAAIPHIAE